MQGSQNNIMNSPKNFEPDQPSSLNQTMAEYKAYETIKKEKKQMRKITKLIKCGEGKLNELINLRTDMLKSDEEAERG